MQEEQTKTINSLHEMLNQILHPATNSFFSFSKADMFYVYRGQAKSEWKLIPKIFRDYELDSISQLKKVCDIEREIYREFFERLRNYHVERIDTSKWWEVLCLAQHFGVPTRLLDWTDNPLVALFFAVIHHENSDGAVWCMNASYQGMQFDIPSARSLYSSRIGICRLDDLSQETSFFGDIQNPAPATENFGFRIIQPPDIDNRMKNQGSFFTVNVTSNDEPIIYDHSNHFPEALYKFNIPASAKTTIKSELDRVGINFNQLYPDLYGLGMYLNDLAEKRLKQRSFDW